MAFLEPLLLPLVKLVLGLANSLPLSLRLKLAYGMIRVFARLNPIFDQVSRKNLKLAFPNLPDADRERLLKASQRSLARFIVDSARFHTLDRAWVEQHIECPFNERYLELKRANPSKGLLIASGHLGSIELQALAAPFMGRRFSFVARGLKLPSIDRWWREKRELHGNQVIERKGAVARIIENLNSGIDVAILIDQNVQLKHALFVDWFGRPAATTFALGLAALETNAQVIISAIVYLGNEKYRVVERDCDLTHIYQNPSLDKKAKILEITRIVSAEYQKLIVEYPEGWFWMHRRWKTTPEGVPEDFYGAAA